MTLYLRAKSIQRALFISVCVCVYLFNVQEVFGFEGYGHALHWNIVAGARVVTHICPHGKRHRFGLEPEQISMQMLQRCLPSALMRLG